MLDIVIPIHPSNLKAAELCVEAIDKYSPGVPFEIILAIDGAPRGDYAELQQAMRARKPPRDPNPAGELRGFQIQKAPEPAMPDWRLLDWPGVVHYASALQHGLEACRSSPTEGFVAIVPPWIEFTDKNWFGKLQQPFAVGAAGVTLVAVPLPGMPHLGMDPSPLMRRKHPDTDVILTRRAAVRDVLPNMRPTSGATEWVNEFSRVTEERGGSRWLAPSVRYNVIEHHDHKCPFPQPEPSEIPTDPSASPSQTTPSSSSLTTTGAGGNEGSAPF